MIWCSTSLRHHTMLRVSQAIAQAFPQAISKRHGKKRHKFLFGIDVRPTEECEQPLVDALVAENMELKIRINRLYAIDANWRQYSYINAMAPPTFQRTRSHSFGFLSMTTRGPPFHTCGVRSRLARPTACY